MSRTNAMRLSACAALVAAVSVAVGSAAAAGVPVVKRAQSSALGGTILVTQKGGRTLYHLSVEKKGRFTCTASSCLAFWKPLLVPAGSKPVGAPALGTVERPDGHLQVTYKGSPLYTFVRDKKPGDALGDGSKDVGVWHAVILSRTGGSGTPPPSDGGYGGYGP